MAGMKKIFRQLFDSTEDEFANYQTTADFGYEFNREGQLRSTRDGSCFKYNFYGSGSRDQRRYEALGEVITEHVYELLVKEYGLEKHYVPVEAINDNEPFSFIFMSPGALQQEKLLLLVHGSGVVRAGQWARRLIINDCLDSGTQIPYIKRAMKEGYGVVVLNPNDNRIDGGRLERERKRMEADKKRPQSKSTDANASSDSVTGSIWQSWRRKYHSVKGNESPEEHVKYVWKHFVDKSVAKKIFVVAFSYGGAAVVNLINNRPDVLNKLSAVAFADSVHRLYLSNQNVVRWFKTFSVHWVRSSKKLNTRIHADDSSLRSAGTPFHERAPWTAIDPIFEYLKAMAGDGGARKGGFDPTANVAGGGDDDGDDV
ncbi:cotranscriptional regulator ARB2A homolog isoform X2 [Petromyzon marinus]|uniref:Cotranscriptional regulator FAM172A homolog isoform X1 n=1 Tax=Petromyzon marinus TaxID=7757 RepID=A0AAJ7XDU9_PETMA|nr:cotranscriptional regulator FAM172A homolog isoform X1 [Petromyzon marinus]XP_032829611.1 cotranscriptional regulator FAM172A homolog isoform X1 [Petromyzon marinus]XP_032829612.1 cotranscriptional regulator FAM172A homolog isoform X1 [Petromyzon marinus]XP_032829613.1 cotranscriptional regulator FAM172A homolog isoform X1 [Petromyzon marinus]